MSRRNLVTQQVAAQYLDITDRSVRNVISRGYLTGFKVPACARSASTSNEVDAMLQTIPTVLPKYRTPRPPRRRSSRTPFGPKAKIVTVVPQAEVVEGGDEH